MYWLDDRSRMSREAHVQICDGLGVKFPWATDLPFGKELQAYRLSSTPTFQAKSGAGRLETRGSRLILHNFGLDSHKWRICVELQFMRKE